MDSSNSRVIQDEQEIKELKEFIQHIYFKQNDDDIQKKEQLLNSIQELQEIAGDDDFPLHLAKLYTNIISRQKENLQEFEKDRSIVDNFKHGVMGKQAEVSQGMQDLINEDYKRIPNKIAILQSQLKEQERQVDVFDQMVNQHLKAILDVCEEKRNGQEKRKKEEKIKVQSIKEQEEAYKKDKESMQAEIVKNRELQDREEDILEDIQNRKKKSEKEIQQIQKDKKQLEQEIERGIYEGYDDDEGLKKLSSKLRDLKERKKCIVESITQLSTKLENYQADNRVIEKRLPLEEILLPHSQCHEKENLQEEGMKLAQQQEDLAKQIEKKQNQGQKIQEQINTQIIENSKGRNTQGMLIVVLVLFTLMLIYRVL